MDVNYIFRIEEQMSAFQNCQTLVVFFEEFGGELGNVWNQNVVVICGETGDIAEVANDKTQNFLFLVGIGDFVLVNGHGIAEDFVGEFI